MAIAIMAGRAGDSGLAARGMVLGIEAGVGADAVDAIRQVALGVADNEPSAARRFLREVLGREPAYDQVVHIALAELGGVGDTGPGAPVTDTAEEIERRRAELFALSDQYGDPESADEDESLLWLMRNQSGTATAGAAGRQLIRAARDVVRDDPAHARRMLDLVVQYGDPAEVAAAYDGIGDAYGYYEDDMEAAVAAYREGAAIADPAALLPLRSLLVALLTVRDFDGVAETAQHAVTCGDPETMATGYWMWGDSRRKRGDADGSVLLYRQAIDVGCDGLTPLIRFDLAEALRDRGQRDEARAELGRAIESTDPDIRARAGLLLGTWAFEDGDLDGSAAAFARVAAIDVGDDTPDELTEQVESAVRNTIVVANRAHSGGAHLTAVRALVLLAHAGWAREAVAVAGERATECAEAGDRAAATRYVEAMSGLLTAPSPEFELDLADLYASVGDVETARATYERLARHDDADVRMKATARLGGAAESAQVEDDPDGELRALREAAWSGEPSALYALGSQLVATDEFAEARTVLAAVPAADPGFGRLAMVELGHTYQDSDPARARELFLRVLDAPDDRDSGAVARARMFLGAMAKEDRDWTQALRWYEPVVDSGDPDQASLAAAHLGELAYWLGDFAGVVRFYKRTLATGTDDAELVGEAAYRLAEVRYAAGDVPAAHEYLRQALAAGDEEYAAYARTLLTTIDGG
jgi:tetratricopeptide (TPR) repeat protein